MLLSHLSVTCWSCGCCDSASCHFCITVMSIFSTTKLFHQGLLEIFIIHKVNKWVDCAVQEVHADTEMIDPTIPIHFKTKMIIEVENVNFHVADDKEKSDYKKSFDEIISGQFKLSPLCIFTAHVGYNSCPDDP